MMNRSASASGPGQLTTKALIELLEDIPDEATLTIRTESGDQRDGPYWSLQARWGEVGHTS